MLLKKSLQAGLLTAVLCFPAATAWGAGGEVSGFVGGMSFTQGVGTHATFGGSLALNAHGGLDIFFEASGARLASLSESGGGVAASGSADLVNFGGGVEYNFGSSKRVLPYALGAVGAGHCWVSATASSGGVTASASESLGNSPYLAVGGGVKVFIGKHWGVKPEIRFQRYTSQNFAVSSAAAYTVGLFWRSGSE